MDWFGLLAIQGTLKSLIQHRSSKASILWQSAFFVVLFSHAYMTTGKTTALTLDIVQICWTYEQTGLINALSEQNSFVYRRLIV